MGIKNKLKLLGQISIPKFIYYNFLSKKVVREGKGYLIPYKHAVIELAQGAKIYLKDGIFHVNYFAPKHSNAEAYLRMRKGAILRVVGNTHLTYSSTIEIHENAEVTIGSAYINTGSVILAAERIDIGSEVLISRETFIFDSDHHPILNENDEPVNPPRPVVIEDHVWIGLRCILLRGSRIGTGVMVSAGSVVGGKIKPGTMASGNPARSYSEIKWRTHL